MDLQDKSQLIKLFSFLYRTTVASAPLLDFAIERCDGADLMVYYEKHVAEERGHDAMLRDDLTRLGVAEVPPSFKAAQIAGSQYYLIAHDHPAMLLGYMHALEKESLPLSVVDELSKHHGVELTALRHHAEHDPQHKVDLEAVIAGLPPQLRERVEWNERCVMQALIDAIEGELT